MGQQAGKPVKPPRRTFPATGNLVRMELQAKGARSGFRSIDTRSGRPRYLGQATLRSHATCSRSSLRIQPQWSRTGRCRHSRRHDPCRPFQWTGTIVRTVFDEVIYCDPSSIENGVLDLLEGTRDSSCRCANAQGWESPVPFTPAAAAELLHWPPPAQPPPFRATRRRGNRSWGAKFSSAVSLSVLARGDPHRRRRHRLCASSRAFARPPPPATPRPSRRPLPPRRKRKSPSRSSRASASNARSPCRPLCGSTQPRFHDARFEHQESRCESAPAAAKPVPQPPKPARSQGAIKKNAYEKPPKAEAKESRDQAQRQSRDEGRGEEAKPDAEPKPKPNPRPTTKKADEKKTDGTDTSRPAARDDPGHQDPQGRAR